MPINVFVSVGRPATPRQEDFVKAIEAHLASSGMRPRTVGRNVFTHTQPLRAVSDLMDHCAGAIVLAFERLYIEQGRERRGGPDEAPAQSIAIATPWNQIEAAFAYARRVPLLVIREPIVRADGLLEPRYDWYVHTTSLEPQCVSDPAFLGMFESWRRDVRKRAGWFGYRG